jgi:hypothetical protein
LLLQLKLRISNISTPLGEHSFTVYTCDVCYVTVRPQKGLPQDMPRARDVEQNKIKTCPKACYDRSLMCVTVSIGNSMLRFVKYQ